jgi:hypothetical protein
MRDMDEKQEQAFWKLLDFYATERFVRPLIHYSGTKKQRED